MGMWLAPQVVGRLVWRKEQHGDRDGGAGATHDEAVTGHAGRTNIPLERMLLTIQVDLTRKASNRDR
jgi:hypothetical protein